MCAAAFDYRTGVCPAALLAGASGTRGVSGTFFNSLPQQPVQARACCVDGHAVLLCVTESKLPTHSVHEIHIDDEQLAWFAQQLDDIDADTPIVVFSHAPPIGCGLKV